MDAKLVRSLLDRTKIVRTPKSALSTFGNTQIDYHLVSPVDELANKTRLREGRVNSERPKIITPGAFAERFQGFGEESAEFADWLSSAYKDFLRALEYNFKNQGFSARVISEPAAQVTDRIVSELDAADQRKGAVIVCPDGAWSLALMKFALDEAARSFPTNVKDLDRRKMFDNPA